jgi:hypothetical protein
LLKIACGNDKSGFEIYEQLRPTVETTEEAIFGCGLAVGNTQVVMEKLGDKLKRTEAEVLDNVNRTRRRVT